MINYQKENNLDLLRFTLALIVFFEHSNNIWSEYYNVEKSALLIFNLSHLAVTTFFVVSGMLTYLSYSRDPNFLRFYVRRFFRIFPSYWLVIVIQSIIFIVFFYGFYNEYDLLKYFFSNLFTANFLMPTFIDSVRAINGSLWTIKIEVLYYLLLPIMLACFRGWISYCILGFVSFLWFLLIVDPTISKQLPGKLFLFLIGISLTFVINFLKKEYIYLIAMASVLLLTVVPSIEKGSLLYELIILLLAIMITLVALKKWIKIDILDISYTLYLVHYPILVISALLFDNQISFINFVLISGLISVIVAITISKYFEKYFIAFGRKITKNIYLKKKTSVRI